MLRLTRDDQWFPERISGLLAEVGREEIALSIMVDAEAVRGRFPYIAGRPSVHELRDWLLHVAKSVNVMAGPNLEGWAAGTSAKIVQFANAKLMRPDAFHA